MAILVSGSWRRQLQAALRLAVVFLGWAVLGWLSNGFNVPPVVCIGTAVACCYLAWVGSDGIALASVWVVGLMAMPSVGSLWLHGLPRPNDYKYIPMLLLASWALALAVVWQLGKASDWFKRGRGRWICAYAGLASVATTGLLLGWLMYRETLLRLIGLLQ
jgi:hypothetical protein